jgi:hypothetical protein
MPVGAPTTGPDETVRVNVWVKAPTVAVTVAVPAVVPAATVIEASPLVPVYTVDPRGKLTGPVAVNWTG